jgi:hypothetical protein
MGLNLVLGGFFFGATRFPPLHSAVMRMRLFVVLAARAAEKEENRLSVFGHDRSQWIFIGGKGAVTDGDVGDVVTSPKLKSRAPLEIQFSGGGFAPTRIAMRSSSLPGWMSGQNATSSSWVCDAKYLSLKMTGAGQGAFHARHFERDF